MPRRLEESTDHSAGISSNDPLHRGLVQDVRRHWVVHEDAVLANRLQENEFERKYNRNLTERQLAQQDVRLARQVQNMDEELVQRTRQQRQERMRNVVDDDAIIAEQLQSEEIVKKEQERMISELKDEEIARRLQEKEKKRYELRVREKELRKQRKMLEAELKRESSSLLDNNVASGATGMASSASARERSPDLDGATGNDLDLFMPPSGNLSERDRKELQRLQDEELARHLQNQEQKHRSKLDKMKEIELRDAELAKVMQEQENLRMQKRRRSHRLRETRQSSDPCHAVEPHLPEVRQSHSLPQSHDVPSQGNNPPINFPFRDFNQTQITPANQELSGANCPPKFATRPLPDTPSPELPRGCNMSLLRALDGNNDNEFSQARPVNISTSCQPRDARRMPLVLSDDDDDLLPPPLVTSAAKPSPSASTNIFAAIDPTWNQGQGQAQHAQVMQNSSNQRPLQAGSFGADDAYCDLEDVRALRIVENNDEDEEMEMVPGQRRQPFSRNANRASGQKSNCKQQ